MGLFDRIVKQVSDNITDSVTDKIKDTLGLEDKSLTAKIPSKFASFPKFEGEIVNSFPTTTDKYERYTIEYANVAFAKVNEYYSLLKGNGFDKKSEVRYEKLVDGKINYVIVEPSENNMKIAYHMNKN